MATITPNGIVISRYPELLDRLKQEFRSRVSVELTFDNDLFLGQFVQILANYQSEIEELIQILYDSRNPDAAEGNQLDFIAYWLGLNRLAATKSSGLIFFMVREDVTLPSGTVLANAASQRKFQTTQVKTASPRLCAGVFYKINVQDNTTYNVSVNNESFNFTSPVSGATAQGIAQGIADLINAVDSPEYKASAELSDTNEFTLFVESKNDGVDISVEVVSNMTVDKVLLAVPSEAVDYGDIAAPAGSINRLISGVGGIIHFFNKTQFSGGRLRETDPELRERMRQTLSLVGSGTYNAVYTALRNVSNVTSVVIVENDTSAPVGGLPAHSFQAIVDAPDDADTDFAIGQAILNEKPLGIRSFGDVEVTVLDDSGTPRKISFSRPSMEFVAMRVVYELYDEETPTADIQNAIKDAVMIYGESLNSGVDVIPKRSLQQIYSRVRGLGDVTVYAQVLPSQDATPNPAGWSTNTIQIIPSKKANIQRSKIVVESAP